MKCLDKKRIKAKKSERLTMNECYMLSLVSSGEASFQIEIYIRINN